VAHSFDREYWEAHWRDAGDPPPPNPHLVRETAGLTPGTALDVGCGAGAEAVWLASQGWSVTGADISAVALQQAGALAGPRAPIAWVETDLTTWDPGTTFDLVTTHYAHPSIPQLEFYERVAGWVASGGTLLIVGHLHNGHQHPDEATVTVADIVARLDGWTIDTAAEFTRETGHGTLRDAVVRARRA
jgi:SAM-dependent methyltransferase